MTRSDEFDTPIQEPCTTLVLRHRNVAVHIGLDRPYTYDEEDECLIDPIELHDTHAGGEQDPAGRLRPYQHEMVLKMFAALSQDGTVFVGQAPPAFGKTIIIRAVTASVAFSLPSLGFSNHSVKGLPSCPFWPPCPTMILWAHQPPTCQPIFLCFHSTCHVRVLSILR